ncbi:polysaccharide biosynthesis protein [Shewanella vesiculosa]|uniref:hypothetical protein n=1 Tax=Shewanella vesiculosa TaxID=518738 RepID=UPI0038500CF4
MKIRSRVVYLFIKNIPLLMIVAGAGSLFLSNIIAQKILDVKTFGLFSLHIFVFSILTISSALGIEQAIVRLLKIDEGKITVDKFLVYIILCIVMFSPLAFLLLINSFYGFDITFQLYLTIVFVVLSIVASSFFKVTGDLYSWALVINGWKYMVPLYVIMIFSLDKFVAFSVFIWSFLFLFLGVAIFLVRKFDLSFASEYKINYTLSIFLFGLISIVGFALYDFLDRIIISKKFSEVEFGRLYFQYTVVVSFSLIFMSFLSAKKTSAYKRQISKELVKKDLFHSFFLSILFCTMGLCLAFSLNLLSIVDSFYIGDYQTLYFLFFLGVVKSTYTIVSAGFNVVCSPRYLFISSIYSVFTAAICIVLFIVNVNNYGIHCVILAATILWLIRMVIIYSLTLRSIGLLEKC